VLGRGRNVERVEADAVADDQLQVGQALDHAPVDRCAADQDRVRPLQQLDALALGLCALHQQLAAGGLDDRALDLEIAGVGGLALDREERCVAHARQHRRASAECQRLRRR
jgi:hypothetical protein